MQSGKPSAIVRNSKFIASQRSSETVKVPYIGSMIHRVQDERFQNRSLEQLVGHLSKTEASSNEKLLISGSDIISEVRTPGRNKKKGNTKPDLYIEQTFAEKRYRV